MNPAQQNDWQVDAKAMVRRQRWAWIGSIAASTIGMLLFAAGTELSEGPAHIGLMITGLVMIILGLVWGTLVYMQVIDEQERDANLWATYVGLTTYLALFVARFLAEKAGVAIPLTHDGIFIATIVATLAVFTWKRFF